MTFQMGVQIVFSATTTLNAIVSKWNPLVISKVGSFTPIQASVESLVVPTWKNDDKFTSILLNNLILNVILVQELSC
jgi:hypothetical protein